MDFFDIEYFMNYDLNFAEQYFKNESNNEGMMTPLTAQRNNYLKTRRKKRTVLDDGEMCTKQW